MGRQGAPLAAAEAGAPPAVEAESWHGGIEGGANADGHLPGRRDL